MSSAPEPAASTIRPSRRRLYRCLCVLGMLLIGEIGCRAWWMLRCKTGFFGTRVMDGWYPELKAARERRDSADLQDADHVLLLSGSCMDPNWGAVERAIAESLSAPGKRRVLTHNLSAPGRTSRDSLIKYREMGDRRFHRVIVCDGFNEIPINYSPPEVFRSDYSHYAKYALIDAAERHRELPFLVAPYSVRMAWSETVRKLGFSDRRDAGPRPEHRQHVAAVRTAESLRENLRAIVRLAQGRGAEVVLCTHPAYVPADHTDEKFARRELDYGLHSIPITLWGGADEVRLVMRRHNDVVREVAAETGAILVDQERLLPKSRAVYNDVCHLTVEGSRLFAANVAAAVRP